jgi:hypothetical protein
MCGGGVEVACATRRRSSSESVIFFGFRFLKL